MLYPAELRAVGVERVARASRCGQRSRRGGGPDAPVLAGTARDISAWWDELDDERRARAVRRWPSAEQEAAVLAQLRG